MWDFTSCKHDVNIQVDDHDFFFLFFSDASGSAMAFLTSAGPVQGRAARGNYNTRKMISSGGTSLRSWHQLCMCCSFNIAHDVLYHIDFISVLCTYQCDAPPTTPWGYVGIG